MDIKIIDENSVAISGITINLDATFDCGQCFRWEKKNGRWVGIAYNKIIEIYDFIDGIIIKNTNIDDVKNIWIEYLDLDRDYSDILNKIDKKYQNEYLKNAYEYGKNIHILAQEPLETIISFIISANNNIPRIKKIINSFCEIFGSKIIYKNDEYYTFPTVKQLQNFTSTEQISSIKAGFRDKYIFDAVQKIVKNEINIENLYELSTDSVRNELMKIKGIGQKVADCILLFAFSRMETFPKDVWINRVIAAVYGKDFDEKCFGQNAGIIQQYLFYYASKKIDIKDII